MDTPDPSLAGNEKKVIERETPWFGLREVYVLLCDLNLNDWYLT